MASSDLLRLQGEEDALRSKMTVRGSPRAAIVRKETQKKLKKLQKLQKASVPTAATTRDASEVELGEDRHAHTPWGRNTTHKIVAEAIIKPDPDLFIPSAQAEHWPRDQSQQAHLRLLMHPDNPLSQRVMAWEDLAAQPVEYESVADQTDAWRLKKRQDDDGPFAIYGDEAMFRDLPLLAEQMDPAAHWELTYKLSEGKPSPLEPQHANSIVLYKSENFPGRVSGAVVYDCLGQARVDVNFQHHLLSHGRYQILSGHWHILAVGSHSHEAGLENHFDYRFCPWIWQAIPRSFAVLPLVTVGQ